jgi:hypothetical protein
VSEPTLFPVPDDITSQAVLLQLAEVRSRVEVLEDLLADEPDLAGYKPVSSPRWHELEGAARADALDHLAEWVESVYIPGYGRLAARLPGCWHEHNAVLYQLDWLSELWRVLYLRARRSASTLAGQAEWSTRLLSAAVDVITAECPGPHPHGKPGGTS